MAKRILPPGGKPPRTKRSTIAHYPAHKKPRTPETQALYNEFGRRLQSAMIAKGWSQSELARRADALLPEASPGQKQGNDFRRDLVSHYITGKHIPSPTNLDALAKALEIEPEDLLPQAGVPGGEDPPFSMVDIGGGRANLRVKQVVSHATAKKVWELLSRENR